MKLSIVVPVYNEEASIPLFYKEIRGGALDTLKDVVTEIVFVNDGSTDKTEALINELAQKDSLVQALSFTRNFGKEAALCCGLDFATGDVVVPIDVDLQDPISVIPLNSQNV